MEAADDSGLGEPQPTVRHFSRVTSTWARDLVATSFGILKLRIIRAERGLPPRVEVLFQGFELPISHLQRRLAEEQVKRRILRTHGVDDRFPGAYRIALLPAAAFVGLPAAPARSPVAIVCDGSGLEYRKTPPPRVG